MAMQNTSVDYLLQFDLDTLELMMLDEADQEHYEAAARIQKVINKIKSGFYDKV